MDDLKREALRVLEGRNQPDPARALTECRVSVRHGSPEPGRSAGARPRADVLIHAPGRLVSDIRGGKPPCFDWGNQIERAIREASGDEYDVRLIQWVESGPNESPQPGTSGLGPSGGDAMA